jgi:hypothetical protein
LPIIYPELLFSKELVVSQLIPAIEKAKMINRLNKMTTIIFFIYTPPKQY